MSRSLLQSLGASGMLAGRNLIHDRIRLAVTVTGIVFAVVLVAVELGLFIGFTTTTSNLIDNAGADIWITARNVPFIEQGTPFSERKLSIVLATPGVAAASKYVIRFAEWRRPDRGVESVAVVGFDLQTRMGAPWNVVSGNIDDLRQPDSVFIDETYRTRLGTRVLVTSSRFRGVAGASRATRGASFPSRSRRTSSPGSRPLRTTPCCARMRRATCSSRRHPASTSRACASGSRPGSPASMS